MTGRRPGAVVDDVSLTYAPGRSSASPASPATAGRAARGDRRAASGPAGSVRVLGGDVTTALRPSARQGLAYIPEDRHAAARLRRVGRGQPGDGLHRRTSLSRAELLRPRRCARHARRLIEHFGIKVGSPAVAAVHAVRRQLQKLVIGRESRTMPRCCSSTSPRAASTSARSEHPRPADRLPGRRSRRAAGLAELSEIMALADRVLVMYEGRVAASYPKARGGRADARARDGRRRRQLGSAGPWRTAPDMEQKPANIARVTHILKRSPHPPSRCSPGSSSARCSSSGRKIRSRRTARCSAVRSAPTASGRHLTPDECAGPALALAVPLRAGLVNLAGTDRWCSAGSPPP